MATREQATWAQVPVAAESNLEGGLSINTRGRVVQRASRYLPSSGPLREKALAPYRPEDRAAVKAFDADSDMRVKAEARRVRRFHRWGNRSQAGIVVLPVVRPVRTVMDALACARMDGPLPDWLILYAAEQFERWPKVQMHLSVMGYKPWACQDAAQKLLNAGESYRDGALRRHMNQERYASEVKAVELVLWDWLERASHALLEQLDGSGSEGPWIGEGWQTNFAHAA